ncbi:CLUMA_CG014762, isoform A [Clunio marinus]|uniref:CLUMA_CG014762, isoform A n=1 Tax=Clunio marinus TaxID=568069 RepID=A0A1J1IN20_9DIPT|nr:CLUMA_CG014762, isoform A [Clunio marinus]
MSTTTIDNTSQLRITQGVNSPQPSTSKVQYTGNSPQDTPPVIVNNGNNNAPSLKRNWANSQMLVTPPSGQVPPLRPSPQSGQTN